MSRSGKQEYNSLEDVLVHELEDLYDAEMRILEVLPKLESAAHASSLKSLLQNDTGESKQQLRRMEDIFVKLGRRRNGEICEAMKGLVRESEDTIAAKGDPDSKDAALIAAIQRIKHYEIAGYGSARTFAARLGLHDIARELQYTLKEEAAADRKLTEIAEASINAAAAH